MRNLTRDNIQKSFDGHVWIKTSRQKTGVESNIRLLDVAKHIIEKYDGLAKDDHLLPVPDYSSCKYDIKQVAKQCGIDKNVIWHTANHNKIFYWLNISGLRIVENITANDSETSYILSLSQLCNIQRTCTRDFYCHKLSTRFFR